MVEAAEELRRRVKAGEVLSMAIIVQVRGCGKPVALIRGGFRDGISALGALSRVQHQVQLDMDDTDFCELR